MERKEIKLNMFLWKTNYWEYVFLESAFDNWSFTWLTYDSFDFHTEKDKETDDEIYLNDTSEIEYMFCEYIKWSHDFNCSMNDYIDRLTDETPNWLVYDDSCCWEHWLIEAMEKASERDWLEYKYSDCRWWWRLWKDSEYAVKENYQYIDEENWNKFQELLVEYEK